MNEEVDAGASDPRRPEEVLASEHPESDEDVMLEDEIAGVVCAGCGSAFVADQRLEQACTVCGLVQANQLVTFESEPARVLSGSGGARSAGGRFVSYENGARHMLHRSRGQLPLHAQVRPDSRTLAFRTLPQIASALRAPDVVERARALLRMLTTSRSSKLRASKAVLAACMLIAIRERGKIISLRELADAADVKEPLILRESNRITTELGLDRAPTLQSKDYLERLFGWVAAAERPRLIERATRILDTVSSLSPMDSSGPTLVSATAAALLAAQASDLASPGAESTRLLKRMKDAVPSTIMHRTFVTRANDMRRCFVDLAGTLMPGTKQDVTAANVHLFITSLITAAPLRQLAAMSEEPVGVPARPPQVEVAEDQPIEDAELDTYIRTPQEVEMINTLFGDRTHA